MYAELSVKYSAFIDEILAAINNELKRIKRYVRFYELDIDQENYLIELFGSNYYAFALDGHGITQVITGVNGAYNRKFSEICKTLHLSINHLLNILDQLSSIEAWPYNVFTLKKRRVGTLIHFTIVDLVRLSTTDESIYEYINESRYEVISGSQLCPEEWKYLQENSISNVFFEVAGTDAVICIREHLEATELLPWASYFK